MTQQFKVGDRVRAVVVRNDGTLTRGRGYVVMELNVVSGRTWPSVMNDFGAVETFRPDRFELVAPRRDTPKVGDTVRVVLEGKVTHVSSQGFDVGTENTIYNDAENAKSIEIITHAKPSLEDLPSGSVILLDGKQALQKLADGNFMPAGILKTSIHPGWLKGQNWVQLVPKDDK